MTPRQIGREIDRSAWVARQAEWRRQTRYSLPVLKLVGIVLGAYAVLFVLVLWLLSGIGDGRVW